METCPEARPAAAPCTAASLLLQSILMSGQDLFVLSLALELAGISFVNQSSHVVTQLA